MRILEAISLDGWSAGSWYAVQFGRALMERGHKVQFLTVPGETERRAKETGLHVLNRLDLKARGPLSYLRLLKALAHLLKEERYDIALTNWGDEHLALALAIKLWRFPIPLIRVRSVDPRPPKLHPLSFLLNRYWTSGFIVSNQLLYEHYRRRFLIPAERIAKVMAGMDTKEFDPKDTTGGGLRKRLSLDKGDIIIASLARFSPVKGHQDLFHAWRIVKEEAARRKIGGVKYLLAGYPSEYSLDQIKEMAGAQGLLDDALFLERVEDIRPIIRDINIGVIASTGSEAISRATLEFMSMGKPLVATRVGVIPEIVEDGESGFLVERKDPEGMARAILKLLEKPELRRRMGERGRRIVEERCSLEEQTDRLEEALSRWARP